MVVASERSEHEPRWRSRGRKNQRWSLDFVSDALASSRRFRILAVVDDFSRECLAPVTDNSISDARVARELDRIVEMRARPCLIVIDTFSRYAPAIDLRIDPDRSRNAGYGKLERHRSRSELDDRSLFVSVYANPFQ